MDDENFISNIKNYICTLLNKNKEIINLVVGNEENELLQSSDIEFNGFIDELNKNYLFFNIEKLDYFIYSSLFKLCLIDEIINYQSADGKLIDNNAVLFFQRNHSFTNLTNRLDENYEIPIVGYVSKTKKYLDFTLIFGEKRIEQGILGSNYYFTNFENAKNSCEQLIMNKEYGSGIIKFALFPGIMKTYLTKTYLHSNYLNELEEEEKNNWVEIYDSCYYLDNNRDPYWVMKDFNQQIPLCVCK